MKIADLPTRKASTQFLHVPLVDWPAIKAGRKTEFRAVGRHARGHLSLVTPGPVVCFAWRRHGRRDPETALMTLEAAWSEPLGAISPESLEREGFESLADFRRYWRDRYFGRQGPFKPLTIVQVYRVRPWAPTDRVDMADALLRHLYGFWLDGDAA